MVKCNPGHRLCPDPMGHLNPTHISGDTELLTGGRFKALCSWAFCQLFTRSEISDVQMYCTKSEGQRLLSFGKLGLSVWGANESLQDSECLHFPFLFQRHSPSGFRCFHIQDRFDSEVPPSNHLCVKCGQRTFCSQLHHTGTSSQADQCFGLWARNKKGDNKDDTRY